jgi:hypothetical protein
MGGHARRMSNSGNNSQVRTLTNGTSNVDSKQQAGKFDVSRCCPLCLRCRQRLPGLLQSNVPLTDEELQRKLSFTDEQNTIAALKPVCESLGCGCVRFSALIVCCADDTENLREVSAAWFGSTCRSRSLTWRLLRS